MTDILLIFHFLGLMLGVTGGLGGTVVLALASPAQKAKGGPIRGIGPALTHLSMSGLVLMWPTGIGLMISSDFGAAMGAMFWMKIGFAVAVTFATVSTLMVYQRARRDPKVARLLLSLGPLATLCYVLTIVFAVLAFH
ncbi:MAG: hypothetical protein IPO30_10395 [Hyphomonadaceae bacterium]|jgi:uncharacterized membrane protein SirB2|nr:hypothetical protein [Hyphomonadaceae bacterium]